MIIRPFILFVTDLYMHDVNNSLCTECRKAWNNSNNIPHIIHQIFFYKTSKTIPPHLTKAQRSWTKLNTDFKYILWNSSMVDSLIKRHYPEYMDVYNGYSHWVQRADFARYIILYHYGGIYSDIDIECIKGIRYLLKTFPNHVGFVMYWTRPFGVSNDFIISKQKHPFLAEVISGLPAANRMHFIPYLKPFFTTGPIYLYGRYLATIKTRDVLILNKTDGFISHKTGAAWHGLDGQIIWWIYIHRGTVGKVFLIVIVVFVCLFSIRSRKTIVYRYISSCRNLIFTRRTFIKVQPSKTV